MAFRGRTGSILNKPNAPSPFEAKGASSFNTVTAVDNPISESNPTPNAGAAKHYAWARLYELTRLPVLDRGTNSLNLSNIVYRSPFFPTPVVFYGFFNNVLEFSEVAEQPFMTEWSFSFIVQRTTPSLDYLTQYIANTLLPNSEQSRLTNSAVATTNAQTTANNNAVRVNTKNG
jgi:hypothetical protein